MAQISAKLVKELREKTGAGMMDCKKALAESGGDMEKSDRMAQTKGHYVRREKRRSYCSRRIS